MCNISKFINNILKLYKRVFVLYLLLLKNEKKYIYKIASVKKYRQHRVVHADARKHVSFYIFYFSAKASHTHAR